jgi:hypothetical protein
MFSLLYSTDLKHNGQIVVNPNEDLNAAIEAIKKKEQIDRTVESVSLTNQNFQTDMGFDVIDNPRMDQTLVQLGVKSSESVLKLYFRQQPDRAAKPKPAPMHQMPAAKPMPRAAADHGDFEKDKSGFSYMDLAMASDITRDQLHGQTWKQAYESKQAQEPAKRATQSRNRAGEDITIILVNKTTGQAFSTTINQTSTVGELKKQLISKHFKGATKLNLFFPLEDDQVLMFIGIQNESRIYYETNVSLGGRRCSRRSRQFKRSRRAKY